jgi:hypothetical protein
MSSLHGIIRTTQRVSAPSASLRYPSLLSSPFQEEKPPSHSRSQGAFLRFRPQRFLVVPAAFSTMIAMIKVEQIKQVADRRRILRHVRIVVIHTWVWQVVAAASADCR